MGVIVFTRRFCNSWKYKTSSQLSFCGSFKIGKSKHASGDRNQSFQLPGGKRFLGETIFENKSLELRDFVRKRNRPRYIYTNICWWNPLGVELHSFFTLWFIRKLKIRFVCMISRREQNLKKFLGGTVFFTVTIGFTRTPLKNNKTFVFESVSMNEWTNTGFVLAWTVG